MKKIKLGHRNVYALIDDEDLETVSQHHWYLAATGYAHTIKQSNKRVIFRQTLHRFLLSAKSGQVIDHINGNKLDNRRVNLRLCSVRENCFNTGRRGKRNRYKGVRPRNGRWTARIGIDREQIYLGRFDTPEEAARAYNVAARKYHGEFARLNEVD